MLARHAGIDPETGQFTDQPGSCAPRTLTDGPRRLVISSDFYAVYQLGGRRPTAWSTFTAGRTCGGTSCGPGTPTPTSSRSWTAAWLERIKTLYAAHDAADGHLADRRRARPGDKPGGQTAAAAHLEEAYAAWDTALKVDRPDAHQADGRSRACRNRAKKALATLDREWDGLAAHRDYPMISLDNNAAERTLRGPVVTRKNAYGSRNEDSARLAARIWTVTATAQMAGLNVLTYLTAYLDACGRNGGKPPTGPALERFLPWTASPRRPPRLGDTTPGPG